MLSALIEPFQFSFMVNAILVAAIVAVPCALLSVFLVLKGWALMGDAMSHAVFPGVVVAYILGIPFAIGAFLVICLVVTPGATAWLLTDRFPRLLAIAVAIGSLTSFFGAWLSYYLDGATGGIIVVAQTLLFLAAFVFAPKHGLLASRRRAREASC